MCNGCAKARDAGYRVGVDVSNKKFDDLARDIIKFAEGLYITGTGNRISPPMDGVVSQVGKRELMIFNALAQILEKHGLAEKVEK